MNTSKYIKAIVGEGNYSVTSPITQWDYGYVLQIEGIELPATYEVDFSNARYDGEALTAYGNAEGVEVPEELIETGRDIYAFYYFIGPDYGKTTYTWKIPNELRAKRGDKQPTPSQQDVVDQAIARINEAVVDTERDANAAAQSAEKAEAAAEHYPKIEEGTWRIWDAENETWIDTGLEAEGTDGIDGVDGVDGRDGVDGYSPVVTVTNSPTLGAHTISIRDKNGTQTATIYDGLSVIMLNSNFIIPTNVNGVLTSDVTLRASFRIRKANAVINGSISTAGTVQMDDPNDPSNARVLNWSSCVSIANPYSEITLPAGYKMHDGDSGTFSIMLTADGKDFTFTPAWSIAKQGAKGDKGDKGDPGEPALGMDIHICISGEYNATTRVPTISEPDAHTFYLVPSADSETTELFVEWIYINNAWEKFGSAAIALKRIKDDPSANGGVIEGDFYSVRATGLYSHAEGMSTNASGLEAHAEGAGTTASGDYSHSEGGGTRATAAQSHAEGGATTASATNSHAEGGGTTASGTNSHAEGNGTQATGNQSHAEGKSTTANGHQSHAEGENTVAQGNSSHSSGSYTIARRRSQFVIGEFNAGDAEGSESTRGDYIFIAGNGANVQSRSNAMTLDWNGNEKLAGSLTLGTNTQDETTISASELKALKALDPVDDVQVNGTSIVQNGVAEIPIGGNDTLGVFKLHTTSGLTVQDGTLKVQKAELNTIKAGVNNTQSIVPVNQHSATFYGLAKAAGDTTQSQSSNAVGTYTDDAKDAIRGMIGAASDEEVSDLKSGLTALTDGETTKINGYWDESFGSGSIGPNIYKSDTLVVPSGKILKNVRFFSDISNVSGYVYILDPNDKILSKIAVTSTASEWTTVTINKTYDVDVYIAVSGASIKYTYSMGEKTAKYSLGLYEGQYTENTKGVGDTLTLAHNVPTRYYSFGVDVSYGTEGITGQVVDLTTKMANVDYEINPSDYVMPLVVKKESGYTLIGRWFDRPYSAQLDYHKCCNCGGQSIMFKVKGATSVNVKIGELTRDPSIEDYLMTEVPFLAYSIDGSTFTRVQADYSTGNSITIPDTLEHLVWVVIDGMNMTTKNGVNRESGWCGAYLDTITTDGTTYAVDIKNKQILFVGNSMIEGINTLGTTSTASANSAVSEFSFKTAQKLNAIPLLQGYGGSTVWTGMNWAKQSYTGADNFITTMTPDLIVIEYGHNDNTVINNGTKTVAEFISEYENLIAVLRGQYTGCPIICMIPFKQYLADAIRTVVANTDCCFLIETSSYEVTFSDGRHPNASGATAIAESLSADILKIMGRQFFIS